MRRIPLPALVLFCVSAAAFAQEFKPYPQPKISHAQWGAYYDEVREAHGQTERRAEEQRLVTFTDHKRGMSFAFTLPGHPAHPAWITRRLVEHQDGGVYMDQIGYFAGAEEPFAELFDQYRRLNEKMEARFKKRRKQ